MLVLCSYIVIPSRLRISVPIIIGVDIYVEGIPARSASMEISLNSMFTVTKDKVIISRPLIPFKTQRVGFGLKRLRKLEIHSRRHYL